jgi:hypothetical protein
VRYSKAFAGNLLGGEHLHNRCEMMGVSPSLLATASLQSLREGSRKGSLPRGSLPNRNEYALRLIDGSQLVHSTN